MGYQHQITNFTGEKEWWSQVFANLHKHHQQYTWVQPFKMKRGQDVKHTFKNMFQNGRSQGPVNRQWPWYITATISGRYVDVLHKHVSSDNPMRYTGIPLASPTKMPTYSCSNSTGPGTFMLVTRRPINQNSSYLIREMRCVRHPWGWTLRECDKRWMKEKQKVTYIWETGRICVRGQWLPQCTFQGNGLPE